MRLNDPASEANSSYPFSDKRRLKSPPVTACVASAILASGRVSRAPIIKAAQNPAANTVAKAKVKAMRNDKLSPRRKASNLRYSRSPVSSASSPSATTRGKIDSTRTMLPPPARPHGKTTTTRRAPDSSLSAPRYSRPKAAAANCCGRKDGAPPPPGEAASAMPCES